MIDLRLGDCLNVMKTIPSNSIDLTVTSPPYDNLRTYNGYTFNFEEIAKELYRVTKDGGVIVWIVGDSHDKKGSETLTSFKHALYFKEIGFNIHDTMIYQKNSYPFTPSNRYYQQFEYMFVISKGKPKTTNIQTQITIWKKDIAYNHPAIFPDELARRHILSWSNENDIVFDPMMGSRTTGKWLKN